MEPGIQIDRDYNDALSCFMQTRVRNQADAEQHKDAGERKHDNARKVKVSVGRILSPPIDGVRAYHFPTARGTPVSL